MACYQIALAEEDRCARSLNLGKIGFYRLALRGHVQARKILVAFWESGTASDPRSCGTRKKCFCLVPQHPRKSMFDPPRCTACFKRIKLSGGLSSFKRIRGLGGAMCAFHVFRGYQPAQTTLLIRGLGGAMCVFHMFERYQRAKTTIIIRV